MKVNKTKDKIRIEIKTEAEILQLQLEDLGKMGPAGLTKEAEAARAGVIKERVDQVQARLAELAGAAPAKRVVFILSPLTRLQKSDVLSSVSVKAGQILEDSMTMSSKAIRYALKGIEGLENGDGTPYQLQLDPSGVVTDEGMDDLLNLDEASQVLITASMQLAGTGMPAELRNKQGGVMQHVVVIKDPKG